MNWSELLTRNFAFILKNMAGFDIFKIDGQYIGHSESDDPMAAALFFLQTRGDPELWAISLVENDDGSILATFQGRSVVLRPISTN